jgi:hypothetical protein
MKTYYWACTLDEQTSFLENASKKDSFVSKILKTRIGPIFLYLFSWQRALSDPLHWTNDE